MKNICFFNGTKFWGGGEKLHLEYAEQFKKRGYNVFMVCRQDSPLHQRSLESGIECFCVSTSNRAFLNPLKHARLKKFYRSQSIDTVLFSNSSDVKLGGISTKKSGVANIVYLRGLATTQRNSMLNRYLFGKVLTDIIANSEETKRCMRLNLAETISDDDVAVIYHGIDIVEFDQAANEKGSSGLDRKPGQILIGNAGRLTEQKGQQYLVEIACALREKKLNFKIVVAGTGQLVEPLRAAIQTHKLEEHIELLGFVENIKPFMQDIDIFALTSLWEGFGYVLVEAMIYQKPIVAFAASSNPEIISADETGYLVETGNAQEFAEQLAILIESESQRQTMGEKGRASVLKRFDLTVIIDELEQHLLKKDRS